MEHKWIWSPSKPAFTSSAFLYKAYFGYLSKSQLFHNCADAVWPELIDSNQKNEELGNLKPAVTKSKDLRKKTMTYISSSAEATHLRLLELNLQITEVHVFVAEPLCPTQTDAIDNGGMV